MKNNVSEMEREVSGSGVVQLWQVLALFDTITITITIPITITTTTTTITIIIIKIIIQRINNVYLPHRYSL